MSGVWLTWGHSGMTEPKLAHMENRPKWRPRDYMRRRCLASPSCHKDYSAQVTVWLQLNGRILSQDPPAKPFLNFWLAEIMIEENNWFCFKPLKYCSNFLWGNKSLAPPSLHQFNSSWSNCSFPKSPHGHLTFWSLPFPALAMLTGALVGIGEGGRGGTASSVILFPSYSYGFPPPQLCTNFMSIKTKHKSKHKNNRLEFPS